MKKTLLALALIITAAALTLGSAGTVAAKENGNGNGNGNAYGHQKGAPGNSAWGRSHNPNYAPIVWGGQNFSDLEQLLERLRALLAQFRTARGQGYATTTTPADVDVTTEAARSVDEDGATLRGELDFMSEDTARVWFEYGTKKGGALRRTAVETLEDEDGGTATFDAAVSGLREDTKYFFRAVAEDEDGARDYGTRLTFTTSDEDDDEDENEDSTEPDVTTDEADDVSTTSATLRGEVDMNDFENGVVFFVYGEDEDAVQDVADDFDTYADVDENGDELRKVLVDSDLDEEDAYEVEVDDLNDETAHYYAMAVAYEDEDGKEVIRLGSVRSFETD